MLELNTRRYIDAKFKIKVKDGINEYEEVVKETSIEFDNEGIPTRVRDQVLNTDLYLKNRKLMRDDSNKLNDLIAKTSDEIYAEYEKEQTTPTTVTE